jgi:hypothetical protein
MILRISATVAGLDDNNVDRYTTIALYLQWALHRLLLRHSGIDEPVLCHRFFHHQSYNLFLEQARDWMPDGLSLETHCMAVRGVWTSRGRSLASRTVRPRISSTLQPPGCDPELNKVVLATVRATSTLQTTRRSVVGGRVHRSSGRKCVGSRRDSLWDVVLAPSLAPTAV